MSDDQADEPREQPPTLPVTLELTAGAVTINIRAHEPLDQVAAVAGELLKQATADGPRPQPVGFAAGSMVHLEQPCTEPAEPYGAARSGT